MDVSFLSEIAVARGLATMPRGGQPAMGGKPSARQVLSMRLVAASTSPNAKLSLWISSDISSGVCESRSVGQINRLGWVSADFSRSKPHPRTNPPYPHAVGAVYGEFFAHSTHAGPPWYAWTRDAPQNGPKPFLER